MSSVSREQLENWVKSQEPHGKILDIGGSQKPIYERGNCRKEDVTILDLEEPHQGEVPDIIWDIQEPMPEYLESDAITNFDSVFCLEVSEYWHDPVQALRNIHLLMKPYGTLYISFHWLYGLHPPRGEDCLRYTQYAIEKILQKTGFRILDMEVKVLTDQGKDHLMKFYASEGMRVDRVDESLFDEGYLIVAQRL